MTLQRRAPLLRSMPLSRSTRPRKARVRVAASDAGRQAWKTPRWGRCENCGLIDVLPLHGHHVIARQVLARAGADEWNEQNRMDLCAACHGGHEFGMANRKIPVEKIPEAALVFAVDVLGEDGAAFYIARHYLSEGAAA